jgi:hypothetical protein
MSLKKLNQSGNAIIIAMMIAGFLAVIATGLITYLSKNRNSTAKASQKMSMSDKIKQIRLLTNDIDSCSAFIKGVVFKPVADAKTSLLNLNLGTTSVNNFISGQYVPDTQVILKDIFLIPTDPPLSNYLKFPVQISPGIDNSAGLYKIKAKIVFELGSQMIWNGYSPEHAIEVYVRYINTTNGNGIAISCNSANSPSEACDTAQLIPHATKTWGWALSDRTNLELWSCQPNKTCFSSANSLVSDPSQCISPFSARMIGATPTYLCLWCNTRPYPP